MRAVRNKVPIVFNLFLCSIIMTDIRLKYIRKCTILSIRVIPNKGTLSNVSELVRLRYIIMSATIIENIFFFSILKFCDKFKRNNL
jgi:hypothetical protein